MTDLADLVDSLKREVAIPGTFSTVFPNMTARVRYETPGNVFEQDRGAGMLKETLKDLNARRQSLIAVGGRSMTCFRRSEAC